jgi:hypothetical protein
LRAFGQARVAVAMAPARTRRRLPVQKGKYLKPPIGDLCESLCVLKVIPAEIPPLASDGVYLAFLLYFQWLIPPLKHPYLSYAR